jgi:CheY-like chemotaxis protein
MIKLWLDDERPAPKGWLRVYTGEEAINILSKGNVTEISLDHDLGLGRMTGYDVAKWIEAKAIIGQLPKIERISVHSANPVGKQQMIVTLRRAVKAWNLEE